MATRRKTRLRRTRARQIEAWSAVARSVVIKLILAGLFQMVVPDYHL